MLYYIETQHITYETSYEDGQLNQITEYSVNGEVDADSIDEAIETYFEEILFFSYKKEYANIEDDILSYSVMVDEDQDEVAMGSLIYESWKKGETVLWDNSITLHLSRREWVDLI